MGNMHYEEIFKESIKDFLEKKKDTFLFISVLLGFNSCRPLSLDALEQS